MNTAEQALKNFEALSHNTYPGRVIVQGVVEGGRYLVQLYAITGRSENSRNRVLSVEDERLFTEAADPTKVTDPSLIIYDAMSRHHDRFIVSNGNQTDTVYRYYHQQQTGSLFEAMNERTYEPDAPNFTPRITGLIDASSITSPYRVQFHAVRKAPNSKGEIKSFDEFSKASLVPGYGYYVSTYAGDGNPLPPFMGEPLVVPLTGDMENIVETYWRALNEANRVAIAVKFIHTDSFTTKTLVKNRFEKVAPVAA